MSTRSKYRSVLALVVCLGISLGACGNPDTPIEYTPGCSPTNLVAYINSANSSSTPATINLEAGCDYVLTQNYATDIQQTRWGDDIVSGLPAISSEITIMGNGATITVDGYSFGHFFITPEGNLRLNDLALRNGNRGSGSAIYVEQGHLHVSNVDFTNNSINADDGSVWHGGGAIFNDSGRVMILESSFEWNGADSLAGGAIYNLDGFLHIEESALHVNSSERGGAIYLERTDPEAGHAGVLIYDSELMHNSADMGGAIYARGESTTFYIEESNFFNNNGGAIGGAIFLANSSLSLSMDTFDSNLAFFGGAVFNYESSQLAINDSQFQYNHALYYGGGVLNAWGDLEIDNSTFSGNRANNRGGGIYSTDDMVMRGSVIDNNSANQGAGGCLAEHDWHPWCDYLEVCTAGNDDPQAEVTESTIEFNDAAEDGGGFYLAKGDLTVEKCTVRENSAGDSAGGIHVQEGNLTLINSTISGNTSDSGAGLDILAQGEAEITHSTIARNSGGGLQNTGQISIHNTIVAWNRPGDDCAYTVGTGSISVSGENLGTDGSCESFSLPDDNPQIGDLYDNGGSTLTHALQPGSIAIDLASEASCLGEDQRGVSRIQGAGCDIGAYETLVEQGGPSPRCMLFSNMQMSAVLLDIPPGSSALTTYVRMPGGVLGLEVPVPGDEDPWEYTASLGDTLASQCSYQGYTGRLYCTFDLPDTAIGSILPLTLYVNGCDEPIFSDPKVSILPVFPSEEQPPGEPGIACSAGLGAGACEGAGGTYSCGGSSACTCVCP